MELNVLQDDSDAGRDNLIFTELIQPANGMVTILSNGNLDYHSSPGFRGLDHFSYTVSDGNGRLSTAAVEVMVCGPDHDLTPLFANRNQTVIKSETTKTVRSVVVVTGMTGIIADLNLGFNITHVYGVDPDVTLTAPDGTRQTLVNNTEENGGSFISTLSDGIADNAVRLSRQQLADTCRPWNGPLSRFNGLNPNGMWTLAIDSGTNAGEGFLRNWFLELSTL